MIFMLLNLSGMHRSSRMNYIPSIVLAVALAIPAFAQDAKTNSVADAQSPGQTLLASAAVLTAPMTLTNDSLCLTNDGMAEAANGGKAVFTFNITNAGSYVFEALVSAPDDTSNSVFVNVDTVPNDEMIWDFEAADGFQKRVSSWRGTGDATTPEFAPKTFKLEPGAHKVILAGREPGTLLKSLTIRPAPPAATPAPAAP